MSSFEAIVTSHANHRGLRHILGQLRYQTRPPDRVTVCFSEVPDIHSIMEDFQEAEYIECPNKEDWGHHKRATGLIVAKADYVGFFNDDDSYATTYLEKMLRLTPENEVVFCNWNTHPDCGFALGSSTSGNFIFRLALSADYKSEGYESDGFFIDKLSSLTDKIDKVDEILYFHNEGLRDGG